MGKRKSRSPRTIEYCNLYDAKSPISGIDQLQSLGVVNAFILGSHKFGYLAKGLWGWKSISMCRQ